MFFLNAHREMAVGASHSKEDRLSLLSREKERASK